MNFSPSAVVSTTNDAFSLSRMVYVAGKLTAMSMSAFAGIDAMRSPLHQSPQKTYRKNSNDTSGISLNADSCKIRESRIRSYLSIL